MNPAMTVFALSIMLTVSAPGFGQAATDAAKAETFITEAEKELADHSILAARAEWINSTYITEERRRADAGH